MKHISLPDGCSSLIGQKWTGGVVGIDGRIYCIPGTANRVLCIDPIKKYTLFVGEEVLNLGCGDDDLKFCGGVFSPVNRAIYGIPSNSHYVLRIDVKLEVDTSSVVVMLLKNDGCNLGPGKKYDGGVYGPDGRIYCAPVKADQVLCIQPRDDSIEKVGPSEVAGFDGGFVMNKEKSAYLALKKERKYSVSHSPKVI